MIVYSQLQCSQRVDESYQRARVESEKEEYRTAVYYLDRCLDAAPRCMLFQTMRAESLALCQRYDDAHSACR